jgi:hypothetical protein
MRISADHYDRKDLVHNGPDFTIVQLQFISGWLVHGIQELTCSEFNAYAGKAFSEMIDLLSDGK